MAEPKQQPPYPLRMPDEMRAHLEEEAAHYKRSLHAHILALLQEHPILAQKLADTYTELQRTREQLDRVPADLKRRLQDAAKSAGVSYESEVIARLERSLSREHLPDERGREDYRRLMQGNMAVLRTLAQYVASRSRHPEAWAPIESAMVRIADAVLDLPEGELAVDKGSVQQALVAYMQQLTLAVERVNDLLGPGWAANVKKRKDSISLAEREEFEPAAGSQGAMSADPPKAARSDAPQGGEQLPSHRRFSIPKVKTPGGDILPAMDVEIRDDGVSLYAEFVERVPLSRWLEANKLTDISWIPGGIRVGATQADKLLRLLDSLRTRARQKRTESDRS